MDKKVKLLLLLIGIALLVAIISTSYAFFTISNKTGSEETITSGTMRLSLHDGSKIETNFMIPGEYIEKTFYVTNTGSLATSYDIYLSEVINDFADKTDLVYTLTSNDGGYSTSNQVQVPSASAKIVDNQSIGTSTTHHYTLRITFLNKNEAQDDNQGKHFSGKIQINEYTDVSQLSGCPGEDCKYLYYLSSDNGENDYISFGTGATPLTNEQYNMLQDDYANVSGGKLYFLGLVVNEDTHIVERAYSCGVLDTGLFCIEGTEDGSKHEYNKNDVLYPAYGTGIDGEDGCHQNSNSSLGYDGYIECYFNYYDPVTDNYYADVNAYSTNYGSVGTLSFGDYKYCMVNPNHDNKIYCSEPEE